MKINVSDIIKSEGAGLDVHFCDDLLELREFDTSVEYKPSFEFEGRIVNLGGQLRLSGKLHFEFYASCLRCLKRVDTSIDIEMEESFVEVSKADEADVYTFEGYTVDIDKPLMDNIILALPMKIICSEDCKGLCITCGTNLNLKNCNCDESKIVDPRMDILKDYFK